MVHRLAARIGLFVLTVPFASTLFAQDTQNNPSTVPNQEQHATEVAMKETEITKANLTDFQPSIRERILRLWQYQFQYLEQPDFILAAVGTSTQIIPNPNKWLDQHSIILQPSELFPGIANRPALVQAAYDYRFHNDKAVRLAKDLCGNNSAFNCLARKGEFWGRLFSGGKVTFSVARRDEVQQQVLLTTLPASQGWQWSYELDFDPSTLYITSSDWSKAAVAITHMKNLDPDSTYSSGERTCVGPNPTSRLADCERRFARPRFAPSSPQDWRARMVELIVPTVQFKAVSQFDFIKQGGVLVAEPNLERTLKTITMTWDLRHIVPSATDRLAVASLFSGPSKSDNAPAQTSNDVPNGSKICVMVAGNSRSYLSVPQSSVMTFCRAVAVDIGADHYALACGTERNVSIGTSSATSEHPEKRNIPDTNCGWRDNETLTAQDVR